MRYSMSGSAAGGGKDHGVVGLFYGDHPPAADGDDAFFRSRSAFGGGDDGGVTPSAYSSITDYLQGLLDPAELARQLDAPARFPTAGEVIGAEAAPFTPNSSTTGEAAGCKRGSPAPEEGDEEGSAGQGSCRSDEKEQKKKKGKGEKKARDSRVAFATKSEVDHLDDGYRWRKYGQKAVKNSTFPRSYYRCTAARCGVKKLVERSQQDPSTVVTTYEGRHGHPSPIPAHRGPRMLMATGADTAYSLAALQHQQHGLFPAAADVYGRMCMQPTTAAAPAVAHRSSEYGGMELHADLLPDAAMGYQHGHR